MSLLAVIVHSQAWLATRPPLRRTPRGNNSIEMAIIIGAIIVVATIVGIAIKAAVDARLAGLK